MDSHVTSGGHITPRAGVPGLASSSGVGRERHPRLPSLLGGWPAGGEGGGEGAGCDASKSSNQSLPSNLSRRFSPSSSEEPSEVLSEEAAYCGAMTRVRSPGSSGERLRMGGPVRGASGGTRVRLTHRLSSSAPFPKLGSTLALLGEGEFSDEVWGETGKLNKSISFAGAASATDTGGGGGRSAIVNAASASGGGSGLGEAAAGEECQRIGVMCTSACRVPACA
mmetsp:Transcript_29881/g.75172  ORF Transcript_29881/g.75172 Transcript_29881/m.75172 type:complete len:224 (+) Transcript_29881:966-1637(+)